jgi:hypothetical protein
MEYYLLCLTCDVNFGLVSKQTMIDLDLLVDHTYLPVSLWQKKEFVIFCSLESKIFKTSKQGKCTKWKKWGTG